MSLIHQPPPSPTQSPPQTAVTTTTTIKNVRKQGTTTANQAPRLLISSPSPRRIKQFKQKLDILNTKYDIFLVKYDFVEINAYKSIRNFFLEHKEYTHLAILPDDLLVDLKHVDKLMADIQEGDYQVISGVCNFACTNRRMFNKIGAIEYGKVDAHERMKKSGRFDYFNDIMSRERLEQIKKQLEKKPHRIIRVSHSAFPLTIIRRDVVEQIEFGSNLMGVDTDFFQKAIKAGIPTYADLDVQTFHLKGIELNRDIDFLINTAYFDNIDTRVMYNKSNPPKREEIFLPKTQ